MKHPIIPYEKQENPGVDRNDPVAAATAIELQFPKTFSARAWRVIRYMEGALYLYSYKGKFVTTDESLELTEYGDGTPASPYGCPRWVGDSLEDLEWWLESVADDNDAMGDIPGWKVPKATASYPKENLNNVLVTMSTDESFIGIRTYDRQHGSRGRFLIARSKLRRLLDEAGALTICDEDCGDYVKITRQRESLHFSFTWLSTNSDWSVTGFRQDILVPNLKIRLMLDWLDSVKHLYIPMVPTASIISTPAASTIREIMKDKRVRRAFSKAMRDCFRWPKDEITLYRDGKYSFFFTTRSGYPKNGGLILHESERDGHPYIYYSVHT